MLYKPDIRDYFFSCEIVFWFRVGGANKLISTGIGNRIGEGTMPENLQAYEELKNGVLLNSVQTTPLSHVFYLAEEKQSHSEPQSPQLTDIWQKRKDTEQSDANEDLELHKLMEDIKRYIRSIDISNL